MDKITIRNPNTDSVLTLDCETVPGYILKSVDWGTVKATHDSYKYVNQVGESLTSTTLGTREVTIEGWVVVQEDPIVMKNLKSKLNKFVNPSEQFELQYENYILSVVFDSTVSYSKNESENNDTLCKFQITGTAFDPVFRYKQESISIFATTTASFHFPLIISKDLPESGLVFGKRSDSLIATVVNDGDLPVGVKIVFKAKGPLSNPSLVNILTQEQLQIAKEFIFGEEAEVYTSVGNKRIQGKLPTDSGWKNYFQYFSLSNDWIQIQPGVNLFRYNAETGLDNLEVSMYFRPEFLEVQG